MEKEEGEEKKDRNMNCTVPESEKIDLKKKQKRGKLMSRGTLSVHCYCELIKIQMQDRTSN